MQLNDYEIKNNEALRKFAPECMVLLKKNGDFPLDGPCKIALYGSGARKTIKGGTGSGEVNSRFFVTVEQGLLNAGFEITTGDWLDAYDAVYKKAHVQFVKDIKKRAKEHHTPAIFEGMGAIMPEPAYELPIQGKGDTAIYVLSRISGEGSDRKPVGGDILLSETEKRDILKCLETYKKFLLVLNVGGPVDLSEIPAVENILVLSQLGVITGDAFADVVLGKSNPSGKLATTWTKWQDYCAIGEFGDKNDTRYKEGIYVGYRYFDTVGKKAMYPFGFGLSYTEFSVTPGEVKIDGAKVTVKACVKNEGTCAGKEVVQLYISVPEGKLDQPAQSLMTWAKTALLAAGEMQEVAMTFDMADAASYDSEKAAYVLEKGDYVLRVGDCSASTTACGIVRLAADVLTKQLKNCLGQPDFTDWKPENRAMLSVDAAVPVVEMDENAISTQTVDYTKEEEIDPEVEKLTLEQVTYLNIGAFSREDGLKSIIGNAGVTVAGAAGETTSVLKDLGFPAMVTADGPAGVRISKQYFKDGDRAYPVGDTLPESMLEFLPKVATWFMRLMSKKPKKGQPILEQYATAIPIGTALAQSFNLELAESCGDMVGAEMAMFGVHLWLAPALNLHRSIRCGRNFEYFSEDPLVSGKMAAAITNGVQKHPGCGTTIKHFAANNQETNRYNNNSLISERAIREMYLRGFEICVKESQPHALMTSYNLMNGVHTSERRDLIEDVLRSEFGYQGIVMTDWIIQGGTVDHTSVHPAPNAARIAAAGGDLTMPGGPKDYDDILAGVQDGTVTEKQLKINATRVYRMAKKLVK